MMEIISCSCIPCTLIVLAWQQKWRWICQNSSKNASLKYITPKCVCKLGELTLLKKKEQQQATPMHFFQLMLRCLVCAAVTVTAVLSGKIRIISLWRISFVGDQVLTEQSNSYITYCVLCVCVAHCATADKGHTGVMSSLAGSLWRGQTGTKTAGQDRCTEIWRLLQAVCLTINRKVLHRITFMEV